MKLRQILILILVIPLAACKELYYPDVKTQDRALVVDGHVTDQNESYIIHLTWSIPFDTVNRVLPANGANVSVSDDQGNTYYFIDRGVGYYYSDSLEFIGTPGRTYTLHIEINDEVYESPPQLMLNTAYDASIYGLVDTEKYLEIMGQLTLAKTRDVAKIYLNLKSSGGSLPRFRFHPIQIIESIYSPGLGIIPHYCWRTFASEDQITTSSTVSSTSGNSESTNELNQQLVGSFSTENKIMARDTVFKDTLWFNGQIIQLPRAIISDNTPSSIYRRFLKINKHQITEEAYQYYKGIQEQRSAEGKIFDPLPSQLKGNINCISDPHKLAFGLFEVSTVKSSGYLYTPNSDTRNVTIEPREVRIPFPWVGNVIGGPPAFWMN